MSTTPRIPGATPLTSSAESPATPQSNSHRAAFGIMIVLVGQLMLTLDGTIVNVALPSIGTGLDLGPSSLSWVVNAYTLAFGGLMLMGGRLGDTYGQLRVFLIGLAVFTASSLLGGFAQSAGLLIAARAAQGIGAALAAPSVLTLLTTSARDDAARNRALALFAAVGIGGSTLGLLLGGVVTEVGSWRWTLFINVPIGIAVLALAPRFVAETPRNPGRFDLIGALSATGAAVAIVWALIGAPEHGWSSPQTIGSLTVGVVLLAALAMTERRVAHPMLVPALLRDRRRLGALAVTTLVFGSQIATFFLVVQYVQRVLHFGPIAAGAAFLPMTLGIFAMARTAPKLVARFGQRPLLITGTLGLTASYVWLSNIDTTSSYATAVLGPLLINGVSAGLTFMPTASLVMGGVEPQHAGSASGLLQTVQQLGGTIGLAVVVSVYAAGAVPGQFVPGARAAFLTTAAFTLLASTLAALILHSRRPAHANGSVLATPTPPPYSAQCSSTESLRG
ncbi:MFS transporter [Streptomyces sp. SLBN-31]|uniref:MFS transporter n=1 Tax=Streptomyces sp. SLBN-31 TaxID=2768444 RepID=UPI00115387F1|nr:MFS transporter [Streptomyces sp. SLBN-31]TQJ92986.1 EmrB/QacA subfamily drug resistance transporter [Streptomyces sp. SLBN-31]